MVSSLFGWMCVFTCQHPHHYLHSSSSCIANVVSMLNVFYCALCTYNHYETNSLGRPHFCGCQQRYCAQNRLLFGKFKDFKSKMKLRKKINSNKLRLPLDRFKRFTFVALNLFGATNFSLTSELFHWIS